MVDHIQAGDFVASGVAKGLHGVVFSAQFEYWSIGKVHRFWGLVSVNQSD